MVTPACLQQSLSNRLVSGGMIRNTEQDGGEMPPPHRAQAHRPAGVLGRGVHGRGASGWSDADHAVLEPPPRPETTFLSPTALTTVSEAAFPPRSA